MIVRDILAAKGSAVVTMQPDATVADLVAALAERRIGAVVVSVDGRSIAGIVSERDVARGLNTHGGDVLNLRIDQLMTADVQTCAPGDEVSSIARIMTDRRFRHLPVAHDGALVGIVSIGDVVKKRIDELETETGHLMDYLAS